MISVSLTTLAFLFYLAATVCYGAVLFLPASSGRSQIMTMPQDVGIAKFGRPLLLLGIFIQFFQIGVWCAVTHHSPFASAYGTLSVLAWAIALAFTFLDFHTRMPAVGAIAITVACVVLGEAALHLHGPIDRSPILNKQLVSLHVLAIVASFGLFAVAFGCAILYVLQHKLLQQHSTKGLFRRLPPLAALDTVAHHSVAYALPLLTVGLAVGLSQGIAGALDKPASAWLLDPHTIVSLATWCLYVLYLTARMLLGWQGIRLQYILLIGLPVSLALYGVPTTTHRFH